MEKELRHWDLLINPIGTPTRIDEREYHIHEGVTAITNTMKGYVMKVSKEGQIIGYIPEKGQGAAETAKELMDVICN